LFETGKVIAGTKTGTKKISRKYEGTILAKTEKE
jgi:hypothetical protein